MDVNVLKENALQLLKEGEDILVQMDEISEWKNIKDILDNITTASDFIIKVISSVEIAANDLFDEAESFKSEDKLKAAADILDEYLKFGWLLEMVDGPILEVMLSLCVSFMNKTFGDNWNLDVVRKYLKEGKNFVEEVQVQFTA